MSVGGDSWTWQLTEPLTVRVELNASREVTARSADEQIAILKRLRKVCFLTEYARSSGFEAPAPS